MELPVQTPCLTRISDMNRRAIAATEQQIVAIEKDRELALLTFRAELDAAERHYERERLRLTLMIGAAERKSADELAEKRAILRVCEAALAALEPNDATREAPMEERLVPRPDRVVVPIQVHEDIRA